MGKLTKRDKNIILKAMAAVAGGFYVVNILTKMSFGRDADYLATFCWAITAAIFFGVVLFFLLTLRKGTDKND